MIQTLLALIAYADIPPPPGYIETCTVENHASAAIACTSCAGYHGGREPCEALEAQGYSKKCQTRGASVWSEVMCRPSTTPTQPTAPTPPPTPKPPAAPTPQPPKSGGCDQTGAHWVDVPPAPGDGCKCDQALPSVRWLPLLALTLLAIRRR